MDNNPDFKGIIFPETEPSWFSQTRLGKHWHEQGYQQRWDDSRIGTLLRDAMTEVRVFRDRCKFLWYMTPHLWKNHYSFDFHYIRCTMEARLKILEKVLREDPYHEGSEGCAKQIRQVLEAFDDFDNAVEKVARTKLVQEYLETPIRDQHKLSKAHKDEFSEWAHTVACYELEAWNEAWTLINNYGRNWWC